MVCIKTHLNFKTEEKIVKTSLKIFKHYKLKPGFQVFQLAKDRAWVGDKPPPPNLFQFLCFHLIGYLRINKNQFHMI